MKFIKQILFGIAFICMPLGAVADGDPVAGKDKSFTCTGCHFEPGYRNAYPSYKVPKIGGQMEDYLVAALTAYRDNARAHDTMHAQVADFNDEDIANVAAYLAQLVN